MSQRLLGLAGLSSLCLLASCFDLAQRQPDKRVFRLHLPVAKPATTSRAQPTIVALQGIRWIRAADQRAFFYRIGEREYESDFFHEFQARPGSMLEDLILAWLSREPDLTPSHLSAASAPIRRLTLDGFELHGDYRQAAAPVAVLKGTLVIDGSERAIDIRQPVASRSADDLVRAYEAAIARLLQRIRQMLHG